MRKLATTLIATALFGLLPVPVAAEECAYRNRYWPHQVIYQPCERYQHRAHHGATRSYGWHGRSGGRHYEIGRRHDRRHDDYVEQETECRDFLATVGSQHLTINGAKRMANDAWAGQVRFRHGERFMSMGNARHIDYECTRSSIKEGGTGVANLSLAYYRCEIRAKPCRAKRQTGADKDTKDDDSN